MGTTLDFEEEVRIHRRMFSGDAVTDPDGNLVVLYRITRQPEPGP